MDSPTRIQGGGTRPEQPKEDSYSTVGIGHGILQNKYINSSFSLYMPQ